MRILKWVAPLLIALAGVAAAQAETYPAKPITLIVPFPAGGPTDTVARIMGEHMSKTLGQSILVETVTGAGATIGVGRVVNAPPDGYTISIGNWSSHVGSPALYPVSWNPVNDLEPIIRLPVSSLMIVGKEALPAKDAKELIAWLKANPDKASAASVGAGTGAHVCGLYFGEKTEHQVPVRVLPRRRAGDAGHAGRHDRHHVRRGVADAGACPGRARSRRSP